MVRRPLGSGAFGYVTLWLVGCAFGWVRLGLGAPLFRGVRICWGALVVRCALG